MSLKRKLSDDDVIDIRELYESGDFRMKDLAEMYGISLKTTSNIINGLAYRNVTKGVPVYLPDGQKRIYEKGEHGFHVLTNERVMEIRTEFVKLRNKGNQSIAIIRAFSEKYGVSDSTISRVVYSQAWKHLPSVAEIRKGEKK